MYKHYPYFRYYHHHFSSDPSPRPGGLRPLSLEGIDGIEQTRTSLLDLLIRAGTRLWSEKTLSGYWFVRNVSWDDLSWEVDSEGDKKPWHDRRDGKDDLAQLQRRETFLRAPAGIRFKVTLSPSAMTVRSFSILLINMGSSLRAEEQTNVSGRARGYVLRFLIACFDPTYELKRVIENDTGPSNGAWSPSMTSSCS